MNLKIHSLISSLYDYEVYEPKKTRHSTKKKEKNLAVIRFSFYVMNIIV